MTDFRFVDLFSGIGGMRLGLERAGGECVYSCEIDRFARQTYETNFGPVDKYDVNDLAPEELPEHDIIAAGFPCQPFSLAGVSKRESLGTPHGFKDWRSGLLFFRVMRLVRARRPRAVLLENVRNLASHNHGKTLEDIKRQLETAGYRTSTAIVDSSPWVPQRRLRLFIVGVRDSAEFEFPDVPSDAPYPRLHEILEPDPPAKYTITDTLWKYLPAYAARHKAKGNGFGFGLASLDGVTRTLSARYYKDGAEILIPQANGANPRRLTPRECSRLMGFPDAFGIPVSDSQAYKQFGNSVAVPAVKFVAGALVRHLDAVALATPLATGEPSYVGRAEPAMVRLAGDDRSLSDHLGGDDGPSHAGDPSRGRLDLVHA